MSEEKADSPLLIYDGDCSFCRLWIDRWKATTGDRVRYATFQEASSQFPQIPMENFKRSVQLITPSREVLRGAHAVFRTLAYAPGHAWMLWTYEHLPAVAPVSEGVYRVVAAHRHSVYVLTKLLWGKSLARPSFVLPRWLFLRLLGLIYAIAFISFSVQIMGLVGSQGILPAARFLQLVKENVGPERYWLFPTLAWFNTSDAFLKALGWSGALVSLLLIVGVTPVPVLIVLWALYLSLVTAGQDFMMFQWDALLLETGFLAIFFAPWQLWPRLSREREPSHVVRWLLRLLLFRLMFSSGLAKLLSGDPTWRHLTALEYHYETQPLPTPISWYIQQLPMGFQKLSVVAMFVVELAIPFLIFMPRRVRFFGAGALILFQLLIALTGNYTFFNLLAIALCVLLFDDASLRRLLPRGLKDRAAGPQPRASECRTKRIAVVAVAVVIILAGLLEIPGVSLGEGLPRPAARALNWMRGLHVVNGYGLFAVMTTTRPEIIIEGSQDSQTWLAYEFKFKPGDLMQPPSWAAPYQPRLDWQMWFAALGSYRQNPWFVNLMLRLLQGSRPVLGLFAKNPFPNVPPRYVRALLYEYHFTDFATRREAGAWWKRRLLGVYFPEVALR